MSRKNFAAPAKTLPNIFEIYKDYTDLDSEIERGEEEEATEAYILVRRGDDDEINKVIGSFLNKVHQSFYLIGIYGSKEKALVTMKTGIFLVRQPQRPGSNRCTYRVSKNS